MKKYLEQGNPASEKKSYNWERQKNSQCNHNAGFSMEITVADKAPVFLRLTYCRWKPKTLDNGKFHFLQSQKLFW